MTPPDGGPGPDRLGSHSDGRPHHHDPAPEAQAGRGGVGSAIRPVGGPARFPPGQGSRARIGSDDVTVIVPTCDEAANIGTFLASVPDRLRLIVVDSSSDDTPRLAIEARPERTTVVRAEANIPEARQIGSDLATTRWLLFTDADVRFPAGYLAILTGLWVGPWVGGIVGTKGTAGGHEGYHRWFIRGQQALDRAGVPAATGSNMLIRRDVLRSVGGFDRRLTVNEDTEVMFRVKRAGHEVLFAPELSVESFDHRRLDAGRARKSFHSVSRCALLWAAPRSDLVRRGDWGYWNGPDRAGVTSD